MTDHFYYWGVYMCVSGDPELNTLFEHPKTNAGVIYRRLTCGRRPSSVYMLVVNEDGVNRREEVQCQRQSREE